MNTRSGADLGTQVWVRFNSDGAPDPTKFVAVEQEACAWWKPRRGGLWTAQWDEEHGGGWVQWCLAEQWGVPEGGLWDVWLLDPEPEARVLVIDTYEDLERVCARWPHVGQLQQRHPAWWRIAAEFDAVHVTEAGQWQTRLTQPLNLYGWDCESTLWLRWAFADVRHIGAQTFKDPSAHETNG